jgi:predicted house-cleaning noncanonical NTP pyrophosphatase (MazG superfamily)
MEHENKFDHHNMFTELFGRIKQLERASERLTHRLHDKLTDELQNPKEDELALADDLRLAEGIANLMGYAAPELYTKESKAASGAADEKRV